MTTGGSDITIRLNNDEALVLFDWLHRCEDKGTLCQPAHAGEQVALWNLSCLLERELVDPFKPNYDQLVREARRRLSEEHEDR